MSDIDEPEFKTNRQCADLYMNKRKRHLAPDDEEKYPNDEINFDELYTFSDGESDNHAEVSQIIIGDSESINDDCQTESSHEIAVAATNPRLNRESKRIYKFKCKHKIGILLKKWEEISKNEVDYLIKHGSDRIKLNRKNEYWDWVLIASKLTDDNGNKLAECDFQLNKSKFVCCKKCKKCLTYGTGGSHLTYDISHAS